MTTNLIFLDIDGVLNCTRALIGYNSLNGKSNKFALMRTETDVDGVQVRFKTDIEPFALGILKDFTELTNSKIVICSMWRHHSTVQDFITGFGFHGWENAPVIGLTPSFYEKGSVRGDEVAAWLKQYEDEHFDEEIKYTIFDDSKDYLEGQPLVWVTNDNGLCLQHLSEGCRNLGFPNKYIGFKYTVAPDPVWG
jgi:hypothetical protein